MLGAELMQHIEPISHLTCPKKVFSALQFSSPNVSDCQTHFKWTIFENGKGCF